ncbi:hypothetical protein EJB05_24401, partial [Eragrostis curvula]
MAATKLNPAAPPFPCPYALHHHLGSLSPAMLPYHGGASPPPSPVGAIFICAPFPVPSPHHHQFIQFPVLHPSPVFTCKAGHSLPARLLRKAFPGKAARVYRKGVPGKPKEEDLPEDVAEPAPHGLPPHKLMVSGAAKKLQTEAAGVTVECGQEEPAPAAAPDHAVPAAGRSKARVARRKAERRRNKGCRDGAVVGPRARASARPRAWRGTPLLPAFATMSRRAPQSKFTTPREGPVPEPVIRNLRSCTTVMVRNIPNRLKCDEMIALLDEHCAWTNRAAGTVVSAYDVVYLPMDFRTGGNYGYAFVNFTTADAARRLCESLHGCGWKVFGSGKTIKIVPAKIQGKAALEGHLSRCRFECATKEYLPAVFTPPRDGGVRATETTTKRVGKLEAPRPGAAPVPPRHVKKKVYAVRGKVQG